MVALVVAQPPVLVVVDKRNLFFIVGGIIILTTLIIAVELFITIYTLPEISAIHNQPNQSIRIVDRNGRLLYELLEEDYGRYYSVDIDEFPAQLIAATLATEDIDFYQHPGFDLKGILRAFYINLREGEIIAGGSTITQQVVRNIFLSTNNRYEKTLRRKVQETVLAWNLSQKFSKDEVLGFYLNNIYYGAMAYGVEAAAQTYFGKSVSELDLAECALIAGLPQAPAHYNPYTNFEAAKKRQEVVLELMVNHQLITKDELTQALNESLVLNEKPYPMEAPHFVMMVRNQFDKLLPEIESVMASLENSGYIITTTLDLDWQYLAEKSINNQLYQLERNAEGISYNVNNASLIAIDPDTGEILALVGSPDYFDQEHAGAINMALTPRQPGSALKPFVYAAALDPKQAAPWTAATMLLDFHTSFTTHDGKSYQPENYDKKEHGPVSVREALASSLNIPAVITLNHVGVENFINYSRRFGITSLDNARDYDLSIALGGGSVSLIELTSAYACFANGGNRIAPLLITAIGNTNGDLIYQPQPDILTRVIDERLAWLVSNILSDSKARYIGFGKDTILQLGRPAAVKTGTTTNFHDNWSIGYTPQIVVGVWVGNTNHVPMRDVTGLTGAAPIWHQFMRSVLVNFPVTEFERPTGIVQEEICLPSGLLSSSTCPYQRYEWFIDGTQPINEDNLFSEVTIDLRSGTLALPNTPDQEKKRMMAINLPKSAEIWAHENGYMLLSEITQSVTSGLTHPSENQIIIQSPADQSVFRLSNQIPISNQSIKIIVKTTIQVDEITIWIDDQPIATLQNPPYEIWWIAQTGDHKLWATCTLQDDKLISSQIISYAVLPAIK